MRLTRRHPQPHIPKTITELTLEATDVDASTFRRRPMLGHYLELNRGLRLTLPLLISDLTDAVYDQDPTAFNEYLDVELAPSAMPWVAAHLAELRASTPSHKWNPHWRLNDLERVLINPHPR